MFIWCMENLETNEEYTIVARSFDEAIAKARALDPGVTGGYPIIEL